MPLLYHNSPVDFHPKLRSPCLLNSSDFIDTFHLRLYNRYGIHRQDIQSLSPNPFDLYHQAVGLRRVVQVKCDFVTPNFWLKRATLQVSAEFEFDVTVKYVTASFPCSCFIFLHHQIAKLVAKQTSPSDQEMA